MSEHRYSRAAVRADFIRAGAGTALTLTPLVLASASTGVALVMGGLSLLFIGFGFRTWTRQKTCVFADDDGVTLSALQTRKIAWEDVTRLRLRYFATRGNREGGWMQLTLESKYARLNMESTLEEFEKIVERATDAARCNELAISPTTLENLKALGVSVDGLPTSSPAPSATRRVDDR